MNQEADEAAGHMAKAMVIFGFYGGIMEKKMETIGIIGCVYIYTHIYCVDRAHLTCLWVGVSCSDGRFNKLRGRK